MTNVQGNKELSSVLAGEAGLVNCFVETVPETILKKTDITCFVDLKKDKNIFNIDISQDDLYRKYLDIEKMSISFYTGKSKALENSEQIHFFFSSRMKKRNMYGRMKKGCRIFGLQTRED